MSDSIRPGTHHSDVLLLDVDDDQSDRVTLPAPPPVPNGWDAADERAVEVIG